MNRAILYEALIFFLTLSYLTIILVGATSSPVLSQQQIYWIDLGFIFFFAVEYSIRLYRAPRKWVFVKDNIFDLIAMLPFDAFFRAARLMRLIRLVRLLKLSKTVRGVFFTGGLNYVLMVAMLLIFWGSFSVYIMEKGINPNIDSYTDAIWWSVVTATTVGYGDISPVTTGGRIIAGLMMLMGIGLIGSITGSIALYFSSLADRSSTFGKKQDSQKNNELSKYIYNKLDIINELDDDELEHLLHSIRILHKNKKQPNHSESNAIGG